MLTILSLFIHTHGISLSFLRSSLFSYSIFHFNCSSPIVCKKAIALHPVFLLKSFTNSNMFSLRLFFFFQNFYIYYHVIREKRQLQFFLSNLFDYYFLFLCYCIGSTACTTFNTNAKDKPTFFLILGESVSVGFLQIYSIKLKFPSIHNFLGVNIMNRCQAFSITFLRELM